MEEQLKGRVGGILQSRLGEIVVQLETDAAVRQAKLEYEVKRLQDTINGLQQELERVNDELVQTRTVPPVIDGEAVPTDDIS